MQTPAAVPARWCCRRRSALPLALPLPLPLPLSLPLPLRLTHRPGGIAELTRRIYEQGASVKDIFHERAWLFSSVDQVRVKVVLETLGKAHNERILAALRDAVTEVYIETDDNESSTMYTRF